MSNFGKIRFNLYWITVLAQKCGVFGVVVAVGLAQGRVYPSRCISYYWGKIISWIISLDSRPNFVQGTTYIRRTSKDTISNQKYKRD